MNRALTKPRLVTREMTEEDMEFYKATSGKAMPPNYGVVITFAACLLIILCGAIYALRYAGWV